MNVRYLGSRSPLQIATVEDEGINRKEITLTNSEERGTAMDCLRPLCVLEEHPPKGPYFGTLVTEVAAALVHPVYAA